MQTLNHLHITPTPTPTPSYFHPPTLHLPHLLLLPFTLHPPSTPHPPHLPPFTIDTSPSPVYSLKHLHLMHLMRTRTQQQSNGKVRKCTGQRSPDVHVHMYPLHVPILYTAANSILGNPSLIAMSLDTLSPSQE